MSNAAENTDRLVRSSNVPMQIINVVDPENWLYILMVVTWWVLKLVVNTCMSSESYSLNLIREHKSTVSLGVDEIIIIFCGIYLPFFPTMFFILLDFPTTSLWCFCCSALSWSHTNIYIKLQIFILNCVLNLRKYIK